MKHSIIAFAILALSALCASSQAKNLMNDVKGLRPSYRNAYSDWNSLDVRAVDPKGRPSFVAGALGPVPCSGEHELEAVLNRYLKPFSIRVSDLVRIRDVIDSDGYRHIQFSQTLQGKELVGSSLSVMLSKTGDICFISNNLTDEHINFNKARRISSAEANHIVGASSKVKRRTEAAGVHRFRLDNVTGDIWSAEIVNILAADGEVSSEAYVDVESGEVLGDVPVIMDIRRAEYTCQFYGTDHATRVRYDGDNQTYVDHDEADVIWDTAADVNLFFSSTLQWQSAWDHDVANNSSAWNYLYYRIGQNVNPGEGFPNNASFGLVSHSLKIGAGEGLDYMKWGFQRDIIAHELGHGQTQTSIAGGLATTGESGALHEALSDFWGAAYEASFHNWSQSTSDDSTIWRMGEGFPSGAVVRNMADPVSVGNCKDWWTVADEIHRDSTVISLPLKLLVTGGRHPHAATVDRYATIPALGWATMREVVKYCTTQLMTTNTSFQQFREYLAQAAAVKGGESARTAVQIAMDLTNVPNGGNNLRPVNMSARGVVNGEPLIGGLVLTGATLKQFVLRGIGPGLIPFGVPSACVDPNLRLTGVAPELFNDNWDSSLAPLFASVGAFALNPGSKDAALAPNLAGGNYTAIVSGPNGDASVEIYDTDPNNSTQLINISSRGLVNSSTNLFAGIVIHGSGTKRVLVRTVGPTLSSYGVSTPASNPQLSISIQGNSGQPIYSNAGWSNQDSATKISSAAAQVCAFPLPWGSGDSAVIADLPEGVYNIIASKGSGSDGTALLEVYVVN